MGATHRSMGSVWRASQSSSKSRAVPKASMIHWSVAAASKSCIGSIQQGACTTLLPTLLYHLLYYQLCCRSAFASNAWSALPRCFACFHVAAPHLMATDTCATPTCVSTPPNMQGCLLCVAATAAHSRPWETIVFGHVPNTSCNK